MSVLVQGLWVYVYEGKSSTKEQGGGAVLWPNITKQLNHIEYTDDVEKTSKVFPSHVLINFWRRVNAFLTSNFVATAQRHCRSVHRLRKLFRFRVLKEIVSPVKILFMYDKNLRFCAWTINKKKINANESYKPTIICLLTLTCPHP